MESPVNRTTYAAIVKQILNDDRNFNAHLQKMVNYPSTQVYGHNILSRDRSLEKLRGHNFMLAALIDECNKSDLDVYIGGSMSIWAILEETNFIPNDIDLYIMDVTIEKLYAIESIIRSLVPNEEWLSIVYKPLHINFNYYGENSTPIKIQVSLIHYVNIVQVLASYHLGVVCVAYSAKRNEFVNMKGRFGLVSLCDFVGLHNNLTMTLALEKYKKRNLLPRAICARATPYCDLSCTFKMNLCPIDYASYGDQKANYATVAGESDRFNIEMLRYKNSYIPSVTVLENIQFFPREYMFVELLTLAPIDYYVNYYELTKGFNYYQNVILCEHCQKEICPFDALKDLYCDEDDHEKLYFNDEEYEELKRSIEGILSDAHIFIDSKILCKPTEKYCVNLWIPSRDANCSAKIKNALNC